MGKNKLRTQLLCTFTDTKSLDSVLDTIKGAYEIVFNKIYVFENEDDKDDMMCTYNVDSVNLAHFIPKTIALHRKKQTNTLYTINALNGVIKELNNGRLDKQFPVPWVKYKNSLLSDNLDLDYVEILIREKFLYGKNGETTYIIKNYDLCRKTKKRTGAPRTYSTRTSFCF